VKSVKEQFAIESRCAELKRLALDNSDNNQTTAFRSIVTALQTLKGNDSTQQIDEAVERILKDHYGLLESALDAACFGVAFEEAEMARNQQQKGGAVE